jgi:hypothetical protein
MVDDNTFWKDMLYITSGIFTHSTDPESIIFTIHSTVYICRAKKVSMYLSLVYTKSTLKHYMGIRYCN